MTSSSHGLSIKKPISLWNTPLKADFKELFKGLSKIVIMGIAGNWAEATQGTAEALSAVGFEHEPGQVAWLLIRRALTKAVFDLVVEHKDLFPTAPARDLEMVCEMVDLSLEHQEICIDRTFLTARAIFL
jgi:NACHT N-terminal Helical domain 3